MLTEQKSIEEILVEDSALLEGHFKLRSGMHSSRYLQCARVLEHPAHAEMIARRLAAGLGDVRVDVVVGPATGGIIVAHELARALGCRSIFAERVEDVFCLRRGFALAAPERVAVAEDVITTGGAVKEVIALVRASGADVVAVASVADRSGGNPFDVPFHYLYRFEAPAWDPSECPLCREGRPVEKPGSRREAGT
ncbi:MAG: orotate phosphoribosyltransferase [Planctomycetes bacterium]|nr:orotate phosphoribosyltransferase [Planctomycetota bacterium]